MNKIDVSGIQTNKNISCSAQQIDANGFAAGNETASSSDRQFDVNGFLRKTLLNFNNQSQQPNTDAVYSHRQPFVSCQTTTCDREKTQRTTATTSCDQNNKSIATMNSSGTGSGTNTVSAHQKQRPLSADIFKTSVFCAYCGTQPAPEAGLYCKTCVSLLRDISEVQKRLAQQTTRVIDEDQTCNNTSLLSESWHHCEGVSSLRNYGGELMPSDPLTGSAASLGSAGSITSRSLCRICQLPGDKGDVLISPCRCSGTMQHVHISCLVHWQEISSKKMCISPRCELCGYLFTTYGCFSAIHFPRCQHKDKILHLLFVLMLLIMIGSTVLSILHLQTDKGIRPRGGLSEEDVMVIVCSLVFFGAFFVAIYSQYRSDTTLLLLLFRCCLINKLWRIRNYSVHDDDQPPFEYVALQKLEREQLRYLVSHHR